MNFLQISLQKRGAAAIDSFELSEAFVRSQFNHTVVLSSGNELKHLWQENEFRKVIWIDTYRSSILSFLFFTLSLVRVNRFKREISKLNPDVLLATHYHPWLYSIFKSTQAKRLLTIHENPFDPKETKAVVRSQLALIKYTDVIVTHTKYLAEELNRLNKPIITVPLGSYESVTAKISKPAHDSVKRVLFFGRILPYKGIGHLLSAFKILWDKGLDLRLTIAGNGTVPMVSKHPKLAVYSQWYAIDEIFKLFQEHDLIVLPYEQATQSGVVSMALAFNLPVVAFDVGGLKEQVLDKVNGLLVPAGDVNKFAETIEALYNDPGQYQQLVQGAIIAKQSVSWDVAAKEIISKVR